jgi:hypothetical protein
MGEGGERDAERTPAATSLAPASPVDPTSAGSDASAVMVVAAEFSECAPVAVGTAVWALLFVIGLFIRPDLVESNREWWIWAAAAGVVLGGIGYLYLRRRQARLLARTRPDPATPDPATSEPTTSEPAAQ